MTTKIDVLSAQEWKYMMFEGIRNRAITTVLSMLKLLYYNNLMALVFGEYDTKWLKEMLQHSGTQNHNLSIRGGSNNTTYTASLGLVNEKLMKQSIQRYNLNLVY